MLDYKLLFRPHGVVKPIVCATAALRVVPEPPFSRLYILRGILLRIDQVEIVPAFAHKQPVGADGGENRNDHAQQRRYTAMRNNGKVKISAESAGITTRQLNKLMSKYGIRKEVFKEGPYPTTHRNHQFPSQ